MLNKIIAFIFPLEIIFSIITHLLAKYNILLYHFITSKGKNVNQIYCLMLKSFSAVLLVFHDIVADLAINSSFSVI